LKSPPFVYHAPQSLGEALQLLGSLDNARPLAGGQSLVPMLNFRVVAPEHVVDLNPIKELAFVRETDGAITIGAMTRQRDIEKSALVAQRLPLLAEAILQVGHRQTRNRGTLGGSLAHLDPAAELPAVATAYEAEIQLQSQAGKRCLRMTEFAKGALTTALEPGELVTEIRFRPWPQGHRYAFVEFARRHGDFAVASACALVQMKDSKVERLSLVLGGVAATPSRATETENALLNQEPTADRLTEAAGHCREIEALEDPTYPAWYRQKLAVTLSRRALERALSR
jgi:carbon-monoxide dehydrogenase medium subunit